MLTPALQRRFDQILAHAKDPKYECIARERIAAATELVDTVLACGLLLPEEWRAYRAQVEAATLMIGAVELKRVTDLIQASQSTTGD